MKKKLEDPNGLQPWVLKTLKSTGENLIIITGENLIIITGENLIINV